MIGIRKRKISSCLPLLLLVFLFLSACEEKTDWDIKPSENNTIVVDARLTNEYKRQEIWLSKTYSSPNGKPEPASGAEVWVAFNGDKTDFLESPTQPGLYRTEEAGAAAINIFYHLQINFENKVYEANTFMIPVANPNPVSFSLLPQKELYRINWNNGQYNPSEEAMYEADIRWGEPIEDSLTRARILHYTLNTIDVSYLIFPQDKEEVLFPPGALAIVKKYSVTPAYGNFLRALLAETEWQGSLFEEARGNLPTNITNGGLGYFSASSVLVDTLVVQ